MLEERELQPVKVTEIVGSQGHNILVGALAALASYALFHVVTVFPLSWIALHSERSISEFLVIQIAGAVLAAGAVVLSGVIADKLGRRNTLGFLAILIAGIRQPLPAFRRCGLTGCA